MSRSKNVDRKTLSDMFLKGADRKMLEHEMFTLRIVEDPEREPIYRELIDYVDVDERYYRMASQYYLGDLDSLDNGFNEDLLLLTKASELPPKLYAEYLRELSPEDRESEKITHAALKELKSTMRKVLEAMI
ncbi:MAG: hypothetical protein ACI38Y_01245 [Candidatus Methanomethylophilaceae archaeon]